MFYYCVNVGAYSDHPALRLDKHKTLHIDACGKSCFDAAQLMRELWERGVRP